MIIRTNNSKGYDIAEIGDTIDIAYPNSKNRRGRVQKGLSHTLTISNSQVVFEGGQDGK